MWILSCLSDHVRTVHTTRKARGERIHTQHCHVATSGNDSKCLIDVAQNFQRVTRQIQMNAIPKSQGSAWIVRIMRHHLDLSTTVSDVSTRRRQRIEGGLILS